MRKIISILFLIINYYIAVGQVSLSGKVELCPDFTASVSIPRKLTFNYIKKKKKPIKREIDTLLVKMEVYQKDTLVKTFYTNYSGEFKTDLPSRGNYRLKSSLSKFIKKETELNIDSPFNEINICLSDSSIHAYFLKKIPYDSLKAKKDLGKGETRIISL
ncbi:hypothetical protein, partial [Xanthovirga aplysinae]|uniref:hypothetical protein n=1 Tax=Xanthovirga aplysinae TaxID=2529853 RepID=UPI001CA4163C